MDKYQNQREFYNDSSINPRISFFYFSKGPFYERSIINRLFKFQYTWL